MSLICFASQKGSPGATATAVAVAAALKVANGRRKVLIEADASGGVLAIRYRMPVEPGLLTLAAAVRGGLEPEGLWRHTQELPGGLPVVVCPDGADQVHAAMAASGALLGRYLDGLSDVDVICDVGRLAPDSPSLEFVSQASALLMVARPNAEQLQPAARKLISLRPYIGNLGWVLVGQKPYGASEVESTYDFPVVGMIADDPRSVASLEQGGVPRRLKRHPFIRSSATLAATLSDWLVPTTSTPDQPVPDQPAPIAAEPVPEPSIPEPAPAATKPAPQIAEVSEPAPQIAELDWLPPAAEKRSDSPTADSPDLSSVAVEEEPDEDWDGSHFTVTADLHEIFQPPGAAARAERPLPRPLPPMPPPNARIEPPLPVLEGASLVSNGAQTPPMPGPDKQLRPDSSGQILDRNVGFGPDKDGDEAVR